MFKILTLANYFHVLSILRHSRMVFYSARICISRNLLPVSCKDVSADLVTVQEAAAHVEAEPIDDADSTIRLDMQTVHVMNIDDTLTTEVDDGEISNCTSVSLCCGDVSVDLYRNRSACESLCTHW